MIGTDYTFAPRAAGCGCSCHVMAGVRHVAACCDYPSYEFTEAYLREHGSWEPAEVGIIGIELIYPDEISDDSKE